MISTRNTVLEVCEKQGEWGASMSYMSYDCCNKSYITNNKQITEQTLYLNSRITSAPIWISILGHLPQQVDERKVRSVENGFVIHDMDFYVSFHETSYFRDGKICS